jgi:hypothetical protein
MFVTVFRDEMLNVKVWTFSSLLGCPNIQPSNCSILSNGLSAVCADEEFSIADLAGQATPFEGLFSALCEDSDTSPLRMCRTDTRMWLRLKMMDCQAPSQSTARHAAFRVLDLGYVVFAAASTLIS